ncbi:DEAD/DEAH box helicase [Lewinella sp. W8]|uniref:DEAD/DEAH box helicase n=1 Tax=Lewinella sp. W8 TaxID=2528208 RepID=UPI0010679B18|nr:DEAD/DEAH box helicase [Lewinella sp. W8]MTB49345.1 DEAD/DEAH box helicase [Lewinella sp. W8]
MDHHPEQTPDNPEEEPVVYFDELDIADELLDALDDMGFEQCTPIQAKAIPPSLEGRDVLAVAQTGTGKTAAFLLPILDKLARNPVKKVNTIILEPTRELAMQVDRQLEGFSYYTSASSIAIYGGRDGRSMEQEKRALKTGAPIVVATPGRLIAHLDLGYADLSGVKHIVLDEADRMLDMGFVNDMLKIIDMLPKETLQILFFSATMPPKIRKFSRDILKNPVEISIAISKPAEKIDQKAYDVPEPAKISLIEHILKDKKDMERILIFCGRKKTVRDLTRRLQRKGHKAEAVSSDLEQSDREERLREFRSGAIPIIVATDVLSRGIHIDGIDLVINFDVPGDAEDYVHRIGRTARASAEGEAITLISREDRHRFRRIEDLVEKKVRRVELPEHLKARRGDDDRDRDRGRGRGGKNRNRGRGRGGNKKRSGNRPHKNKGEASGEPRSEKRDNTSRKEGGNNSGDNPSGRRKQRRGRGRGPQSGGSPQDN